MRTQKLNHHTTLRGKANLLDVASSLWRRSWTTPRCWRWVCGMAPMLRWMLQSPVQQLHLGSSKQHWLYFFSLLSPLPFRRHHRQPYDPLPCPNYCQLTRALQTRHPPWTPSLPSSQGSPPFLRREEKRKSLKNNNKLSPSQQYGYNVRPATCNSSSDADGGEAFVSTPSCLLRSGIVPAVGWLVTYLSFFFPQSSLLFFEI